MTLYRTLREEMMAGGAVEHGDRTPRESGRPTSLLAGLVIIGLLVWLGLSNIWSLVLVIGLLVSVFLHEVGHFVTAGWAGMKRTQFFMGFGPKIWSFHRRGVEYGVRLLPLGAFVRIVGMNNLDPVEPGDEDVAYSAKPYRWRMLVITAGSIMHVIIAVVLMFTVYAVGGRYQETDRLEVTVVTEGMPAAEAGLRLGDRITALDGVAVSSPAELRSEVTGNAVGDTVRIDFVRDGMAMTTEATLADRGDGQNVAFLGVGTDNYGRVKGSILDSSGHVLGDLWRGMGQTFNGIFTVLNPVNQWDQITNSEADPAKRPTTVVGVTQVAGRIGQHEGLFGILEVLAAVNIFVGLFNLIPLLPFDGGHAAIATYERLRSRRGAVYRADVEKMWPVTVVVLMLLMALTFTGLYLDITRPF